MSAVSVTISVDHVERLNAHLHVSTLDGKSTAFVDIDDMTVLGANPEMFRRIAARFSEAAALLAANEDKVSGGAWDGEAVPL